MGRTSGRPIKVSQTGAVDRLVGDAALAEQITHLLAQPALPPDRR